MLTPAGTPPEIVDRLAAVLMDSLTRPEFREKLRTLGFDVIGKGPDAMRRRISEEVRVIETSSPRPGSSGRNARGVSAFLGSGGPLSGANRKTFARLGTCRF